jgi:MarR family transcriptional regulator, transcriptional regulator for hemolysin
MEARPAARKRPVIAAKPATRTKVSNGGRKNGANDPFLFHLGFLVHDVSRMRRRLFDLEAKALGITRSQWWVLGNLSRHGRDGMMQTDLARMLDVGKVTIGGIIDRLESAGYVVRKPNIEDRRVKHVHITPAGFQTLTKLTEVGNQFNAKVCAGLSEKEIHAAEHALTTMKSNIKALLGPEVDDDPDMDV